MHHAWVGVRRAAVERGDVTAVRLVLEQILACAVQCAQKEQYVTVIATALPETVKADMMAIIQRVLAALKPRSEPQTRALCRTLAALWSRCRTQQASPARVTSGWPSSCAKPTSCTLRHCSEPSHL